MFPKIFGNAPPVGGQLPFDLQTESEGIQRRRQLAAILGQQALQNPGPGQMVGRHFVATSPLENIARLGTAYMSGNMQTQADADTRELTGRYNEKLKSGMDQYFRTRQGTPAGPGVPAQELPTEDGLNFQFPGQAGAPAVRGDPRRAAVEALTSGLPALARLGQSDLESMTKNAMTAKDLLTAPGFTGPSRAAAAATLDLGQLRPEQDTQVIDGRVFTKPKDGSAPREVFDASSVWSQPTKFPNVEGTYIVNSRTNEVKRIDGAGVRVDMNNPQRKIPDALVSKGAEALQGFSQSAQASARGLSALQNIRAASEQGVIGGPLAPVGIWLGQLAAAFGVRVDEAKLNNSSTFQSEVTRLWAELMAANGGARGLVKEESERLMQSLPNLAQTPQGRLQIIQVLEDQARANLQAARQSAIAIGRAIESDNPADLTEALLGTMQPPAAMTPRPAVPGAVSPRPGQPAGPAGGLKPGDLIPGTNFRVVRPVE